MKKDTPLKLTFPIALGLFPIGITFGLLGYQSGLSFAATVAFSFFIYAGSSQFAVLGLMSKGLATPLEVFIAVWLINLRHVVLSLAYLPYTKQWSSAQRIKFFPLLTDETFAILSSTATLRREFLPAWKVAFLTFSSWSLATAVGFLFGNLFPDPKLLGLDFALPALFIGITILFINKREHLITLLGAIGLAFLFNFGLDMGRASIIVAALLSSLLGALVEWKRTLS